MLQTTLYQQTMRRKLSDLEKKIDILEQKTLLSYSDKRMSILENILQMKKDRQTLLGALEHLPPTNGKNTEHINQTWQRLKNQYNHLTLLLEGTNALKEQSIR